MRGGSELRYSELAQKYSLEPQGLHFCEIDCLYLFKKVTAHTFINLKCKLNSHKTFIGIITDSLVPRTID